MSSEKSQKLTWTLGFLGASCWVPFLAGMLVYLNDVTGAVYTLMTYALCLLMLSLFRPWRSPQVKLWKPYLATAAPIAVVTGLAIWRIESLFGEELPALVWWQVALVIPLLFLPILTMGRKTWSDLVAPPNDR